VCSQKQLIKGNRVFQVWEPLVRGLPSCTQAIQFHKKAKIRKRETVGITLAMAPGSCAQVGRDSTKGSAARRTGLSTDSMNRKDGSMSQKDNSTQNGNMQKVSSGTVSKKRATYAVVPGNDGHDTAI
jgi:hypothetical protein